MESVVSWFVEMYLLNSFMVGSPREIPIEGLGLWVILRLSVLRFSASALGYW